MELVPTQRDVIELLRTTGALRDGHFACPSGFHTNQYLETALAMRHFHHAKVLSVGLSRLLRGDTRLRALLPELSIVAATPGGLAIAYTLCEALGARQVYWTEKPGRSIPMRFRQYLEPQPEEKAILADDILRSGVLVEEARSLLESRGASVLAIAVLVHQPAPNTVDFGSLPLYCLAWLKAIYYADPARCDLCKSGVPLQRIGREPGDQLPVTSAIAGGF